MKGEHVFHVYYTGLEPAEKLVALPEEMQRGPLVAPLHFFWRHYYN